MPKGFLNLISRAKNAMQGPQDIKECDLEEKKGFFPPFMRAMWLSSKSANALDFDDLLYLPVRLFQEHPEVLSHYQNRWSHLLIDEFQDTMRRNMRWCASS